MINPDLLGLKCCGLLKGKKKRKKARKRRKKRGREEAEGQKDRNCMAPLLKKSSSQKQTVQWWLPVAGDRGRGDAV